ncbi:MAG: HAMP domain-containing histidine kinase [Alphaproteobacteria bacterium]|nr:HAMP domain-containing histidine kinase [Alphaproteobacteria bacterium]
MAEPGRPISIASRRLTPEASAQLREIAHELRNPLNALSAIAQILRDERFGPLGGDRYREYAALAHDATERMVHLCNRLVMEEAANTAVPAAPVTETLSSVVRLFEPMATERGVSLQLDIADDLPALLVDPEHLASVMNNLIANAIKFTPSGGRVTVSARSEPLENVAILVVSDTGVGMEPMDLAKTMDPVSPRERPTTGVHGDLGSGLGLTLVRKNVQLMGGTIELRSRKGVGTCAIVRIPLAR